MGYSGRDGVSSGAVGGDSSVVPDPSPLVADLRPTFPNIFFFKAFRASLRLLAVSFVAAFFMSRRLRLTMTFL